MGGVDSTVGATMSHIFLAEEGTASREGVGVFGGWSSHTRFGYAFRVGNGTTSPLPWGDMALAIFFAVLSATARSGSSDK